MPITLVRHLAGDGDQRDAVELGVGDGGDEVRRAGSAGGHAHADFAGAAGDALGGERAALLVARQDRAQLVREAGERLVQRHAGAARVGEDRVDAVVHQRLDEDVGPAGELVFRLSLHHGGHGNYLVSRNSEQNQSWERFGHRGKARVRGDTVPKPIYDRPVVGVAQVKRPRCRGQYSVVFAAKLTSRTAKATAAFSAVEGQISGD